MLKTSISEFKCCKDCKKRYSNCHDTCIVYNAELLYHIGKKERIREEKDIIDRVRDAKIKGIKRMKTKSGRSRRG